MRRANLLYLAGLLAAIMGLLAIPASGVAAYGDYVGSISGGSLNQPAKVAASGDYVYVTDAGNKVVKRFLASSGSYDSGFSLPVSGTPVGIAANGTNILVGDDTNDCVWIYDMSGAATDLSGTGTSHKLGGLSATAIKMPNTVKFAPSGHIFVVDGDKDKVYIFNADGTANSSFGVSGTTSSGTSIGCYYPCGLAFSTSSVAGGSTTQYFYLGDQGNNKVQKVHYIYTTATKAITTAPTYDSSFGVKGDAFGQFYRITDLAWDTYNSNLVVIDSLQMVGQLFNSSGTSLGDALNYNGVVEGHLTIPTGIAYHALTRRGFVASNQSESIEMFDMAPADACPTINVTSPATPVTLSVCADSPYSVGYTTTDNGATVTTYLFYDNDTTWNAGSTSITPGSGEGLITSFSGAPGSGNNNFNVITLDPGAYYVRGVVIDSSGCVVEAYSAGTITVGDSDADGLNNIFEDCYPTVGCATCDDDLDGLSNLDEMRNNTVPGNDDTDGNGIIDGIEVAKGTDPTNPADDFSSLVDVSAVWFNEVATANFKTFYSLLNTSETDGAWINLSVYAPNGAYTDTDKMYIGPKQSVHFRPISLPVVAGMLNPKGGITIRSSNPGIIGSENLFYMNTTTPTKTDYGFGVSMPKATAGKIYNSWFIDNTAGWETYFGLRNASDTNGSYTLHWYDNKGNEVATSSGTINKQATKTFQPRTFTATTKGTCIMECSQQIQGYSIRYIQNKDYVTNSTYDFCYSEPFVQNGGGTTLYMPGYDEDPTARRQHWFSLWNTDTVNAASYNLSFYDRAGSFIKTVPGSLGKLYGNVTNVKAQSPVTNYSAAPAVANQGSMNVVASSGVLQGYMLEYTTNPYDATVFDCAADVPLPDHASMVLYTPYWRDNTTAPGGAFDGSYQCEIILYNPSDSAMNLDVIFTSADGLTDDVNNVSFAPRESKRLMPRDYTTMTEGSMKVVVNSGEGVVGGIHVYIVNGSDPAVKDSAYGIELQEP